jgi:hypothetical protein
MADIDIGAPAIDRPNDLPSGYTLVSWENPANDDGTITSVEIWATGSGNMQDCEVATFIDEGGNVLSTRDSETIGTVLIGSKQTFSGLDMDVQTGDYIGMYFSAGRVEATISGGTGIWYKSGDHIPCSSETYSSGSNYTLSLYGEGETAGGVTEKTSSDAGSGAEARASGNPAATLVKPETGSGADVLAQAQAILDAVEIGSGLDAKADYPTATFTKVDSGSGAEVLGDRELAIAEAGSGFDAIDSLSTPEAKFSSDAGSATESTTLPSAVLADSETGAGIEALISRLLAALDTGSGAEASGLETEEPLKSLLATELGEGADRIIAKIEKPTKGGGMKLWT